jgi:hypothetical protein
MKKGQSSKAFVIVDGKNESNLLSIINMKPLFDK